MGFAAGARAAFTTIVEAFAKGDTAPLQPLLDPPTFASFEAAIRGRAERRREGRDDADRLRGVGHRRRPRCKAAPRQVTVRFVSEQINVVRNAEGQIADGNPNEVQKVIDLWTFRRDTKSSDPNWLLIKTESEG